jgi:hypothetical protein
MAYNQFVLNIFHKEAGMRIKMCLMLAAVSVLAVSFISEAKTKTKVKAVKTVVTNLEVSGIIDTVLSFPRDSADSTVKPRAIFTVSGEQWARDTFEIIRNGRLHIDWGYLETILLAGKKLSFSAELDSEKRYFEVYNVNN